LSDEFTRRNVAVVAVSQEDTDLVSHGKMAARFEPAPWFHIVADLNYEKTQAYDRTTAYFVDKQGIVRQVFPMMIHHRPSWDAILHEIDRILEREES